MATIVLVEDDADIRTVIGRILQRAGYTVTTAADGAAALQAIQANPPDVVVSDIDMPAMTGIELCYALRARRDTKTLPVLLISGRVVPGDPNPIDAQATAFLAKPFRSCDLLAYVDNMLKSGHDEGQDEPSACP